MAQETFDRDLFQAALLGYERSKLDIEKKIAELRSLLRGARTNHAPAAKPAAPARQRRLSSAARKRIAEAQRQRWAKFRQQKSRNTKAAKS